MRNNDILSLNDLTRLQSILGELIDLQEREIDALEDYPETTEEKAEDETESALADVFSLIDLKEKVGALITELRKEGKG